MIPTETKKATILEEVGTGRFHAIIPRRRIGSTDVEALLTCLELECIRREWKKSRKQLARCLRILSSLSNTLLEKRLRIFRRWILFGRVAGARDGHAAVHRDAALVLDRGH
jgi:serine/threonine protein kinase HipA of HipAB toxin-antitoxin module